MQYRVRVMSPGNIVEAERKCESQEELLETVQEFVEFLHDIVGYPLERCGSIEIDVVP